MSVDTEPVRARPSFCPRESPRYESRARPPRLPPPGRGAGTNFGYPRPLRGGVVVVADAPSFPPLSRCQTSSAAPPSAGVPESAAAQPPAPPPPPYESVVLEDPAPASSSPAPPSPSPSPSPSGDITVEVTAPVKVGEGMSAYAAYGVTVQTTLPSFASETSNVTRRFSDFTWLRAKLQSSPPGGHHHPASALCPAGRARGVAPRAAANRQIAPRRRAGNARHYHRAARGHGVRGRHRQVLPRARGCRRQGSAAQRRH